MSQPIRVAVLVGSLRAQSFSRKIARALMARAPDTLRCQVVEIGDLALYNEDLETETPPEAWIKFRNAIRESDAVLFVTPEYNRSIPGCLKNAVDVGSRPWGQNVFNEKPAGVVSVTPSGLGGLGSHHALRQTFVFLNMPVMQQPEAYISKVGAVLDSQGEVRSKETAEFLQQFMARFEQWVKRVRSTGASADFDAFMRKREQAAQDYVNGDSAPLNALVARSDPATFFPPKGGQIEGAAAVAARYSADSALFHKGSSTNLEVLQAFAGGALAFWTGLQHGRVSLSKDSEPVSMTLRVTEVFRLEEGGFKLVHRHADSAAAPPK